MFSRKSIPASALTLAVALAGITASGSVLARAPFDGEWSVLIATSNGACAPSYRYGIQISDGAVIYNGGTVNMQGRVTLRGAVRVTVQAGSQWANGYGHLSKTRGGGVWRGQGTGGTCSGTWTAQRD